MKKKEIILHEIRESSRDTAKIDAKHKEVLFQYEEFDCLERWEVMASYSVPFDHIRRIAKELE